MTFHQIVIFSYSLLLSVVFTFIVKKTVLRLGIIDAPNKERKMHTGNIPLFGGFAIFLAFFVVLFFVKDKLTSGNLDIIHWLGFFVGAAILMIGGFLDDKYDLKPKHQIIFPMLAAVAVILGGVGIEKMGNPFGGYLYPGAFKFYIFSWGGTQFFLTPISDLIIFIWLLGMMYTTKLLDGLDGLVTGVSGIGALIIFLFTMTTKYYQPDIGIAALVLAGSAAGFLIFNWHPAKIFLGEGGSLFLGYALGVLAIISGGKIAIALLVMGMPIMDVVWTIIRRLIAGKNPFKSSDRGHLHHRLIALGLSQRQAVLVFYAFSLVFGLSALLFQSKGKALSLVVLVVIMFGIIAAFNLFDKNKNEKS
jgi:UDP-GlcNAc:undecaprenyl-phosphate/decaprenyl-phosphate GlcNAc-1-phosphate transferase